MVALRAHRLILIVLFFAFAPHAFAEAVIIDTPDGCVHIDRVAGNRVDLKEAGVPCPIEDPGKASVEMDGKMKGIDVHVDGKYWRTYSLSPALSPGDVSDTMQRAKKQGEKLSIPENQHKTEALQIAEDITGYFQSRDFQERLASMKDKLYRETYGDRRGNVSPETARSATKPQRLSPQERIYLFISSSIPAHTLRNYVQAISGLGDPNIRIVLRGFVGGATFVRPTISFLREILLIDPDCAPTKSRCRSFSAPVIIDPLLFRRYRIRTVPAFVYVPSVSIRDGQMSEGLETNSMVSDPYLLYGDVSLDYALRLFIRERKSPGLEELLTAYRRLTQRTGE